MSGVGDESPASSRKTRYRAVEVGSKLGRFELVALLGEGGMATVFRATDSGLRRDVAVKVLFPHLARKPEVVSRFQREARAVAALDHPNILRVLDVGGGPEPGSEGDDTVLDPPFMVLELIDGGSLRDLFDDHGPLCAESVAAIGSVLCRALASAHDAGIVHRDIKPANIMATTAVDGSTRLVVADFGVAHVTEEDSVVTRTGALLGTPAYMSPEQATADKLDARSDVYSLGATLYKLATGSMPFTGPTTKVVTSIMTGAFVPPLRRRPSIGPDLAKVIQKMMATEAGDRYVDARDTEKALVGVLEASDVSVDTAIAAAMGEGEDDFNALVLTATLDRARTAAKHGETPKALALADRALALDGFNHEALAIVDSISSGRRRTRGLVLGLCTLGIVAAVALGLTPFSNSEPNTVLPAQAEAGAPEAGAQLAAVEGADASPSMAVAPVEMTKGEKQERDKAERDNAERDRAERDERERNKAERAKAERAKAERDERERNKRERDRAISRTPAPDAGTAAKVDPPPGRVNLRVSTWCNLKVDGEAKGTVNRKRTITLKPGPHELLCSNSSGLRANKRISVKSGASSSITFAQTVQVRVNAGDGIVVLGKFRKTGTSFRMAPKRVKTVVHRGGIAGKTSFIAITRDCVLEGTPLRCNPVR